MFKNYFGNNFSKKKPKKSECRSKNKIMIVKHLFNEI